MSRGLVTHEQEKVHAKNDRFRVIMTQLPSSN